MVIAGQNAKTMKSRYHSLQKKTALKKDTTFYKWKQLVWNVDWLSCHHRGCSKNVKQKNHLGFRRWSAAFIYGYPVLTLLVLETEYSGLFVQCHVCCFPGTLSRLGSRRHGNGIRGYATCKVAPLWIWSSSVEQNPRYGTKYEATFYNL